MHLSCCHISLQFATDTHFNTQMQSHAVCIHLSQFSVNTTEPSGGRGNLKCKFRRHLIWRIDRPGAVCTEKQQRAHGFKYQLASSDRNTKIVLKTKGSDSWTVTAVFRTEPVISDSWTVTAVFRTEPAISDNWTVTDVFRTEPVISDSWTVTAVFRTEPAISDSWTVTAVFRTEPAMQATRHEQIELQALLFAADTGT
jgi:hypothetical protein